MFLEVTIDLVRPIPASPDRSALRVLLRALVGARTSGSQTRRLAPITIQHTVHVVGMLEGILAMEEEHADDLNGMLDGDWG